MQFKNTYTHTMKEAMCDNIITQLRTPLRTVPTNALRLVLLRMSWLILPPK